MAKRITFVGLYVQENSFSIALADAGRDESLRFYGKIGGDMESPLKTAGKLQSSGATLARLLKQAPAVMRSTVL